MKIKIQNKLAYSVLLIISAFTFQAQESLQGIYLNATDFTNNKLAYSHKHTHIKLHEVFKTDLIEVKYNDSLFTYKKKDVFGYRDKDGQTFRFYNEKNYPILNPAETILIYKLTTGMGLKNQPVQIAYYFSKDADSAILPLTMKNIEQAFSENKMFQELLEIHFKKDNELTDYDSTHNEYELNRLLELSKNNIQIKN